MYEIWIKKGDFEYKLDENINLIYETIVEMVEYLKASEEFKNYEIEIRKNSNLN